MKVTLCAAALALASAAAPSAMAQSAPEAEAMFRATTLSLSAEGETKVAPDLARITLGVSNQAPSAAAAMQANAIAMERVMAAVRKAGVADRDLRTAQLSVSPQYAYEQGSAPRLTGYQASNQVTVTSHDLKNLGAILDGAVAAGANEAGGVGFDVADRTAAEDEARLAAVKALQRKAELYARASGYRIVRLVSLSEGGGYAPPPPIPMARSMVAAAPATQVSPGEINVQVSVSGLFELAR